MDKKMKRPVEGTVEPTLRGIGFVGTLVFVSICLVYGIACVLWLHTELAFIGFYMVASVWTAYCLHASLQWYGAKQLGLLGQSEPPADHPGQRAVLASALIYWSAVAVLLASAQWIPQKRKLAVYVCQFVLLAIAAGTFGLLRWLGKRMCSYIEAK